MAVTSRMVRPAWHCTLRILTAFIEQTFACMKAAYDSGINFFDCAEGYAGGESERVMGAAIKKYGWKRNDLVISTKINWGAANGDNPVNNGGLSRKHLVEGTNAALERLGLDYVDLIYAHRPDRNTPMEETVRGFNWLIEQGKAFYWGTSEWRADEIERAWAVAQRLNLIGPVMEQPEYNLLKRTKVEDEFRLLYEVHGLGLTIFSPLKQGILSGKYNNVIPDESRLGKSDDPWAQGMREKFGSDDWIAEVKQIKSLEPIAKKLDTSLAGLAMAWVLKNPHISSAITGASRPEQIYDSVRSLAVVPKLTTEIMDEIDALLKNKPEKLTRRF